MLSQALASPHFPALLDWRMAAIRIIGFDPGLRHMGWGVIRQEGSRLSHVAHGTIESGAGGDLATRLKLLFEGACAVLAEHAPDEAAVEQTFVNKDAVATLKLGHARAIALLAPALSHIPVSEYAPNQVKKSLVGAGLAEKAQVMAMVKHILPQCGVASSDAADALAVAITHAHHRKAAAALLRLRA